MDEENKEGIEIFFKTCLMKPVIYKFCHRFSPLLEDDQAKIKTELLKYEKLLMRMSSWTLLPINLRSEFNRLNQIS